MKIKTITLSSLVILFLGFSNAQSTEIYKCESKVESPDYGNYNVNILYLYHDGTYKIFWQTYSNKKMAKKNVILDLKEENGKWLKEDGFLILYPSETKQEMKFNVDKKKLRYIMENGKSGSIWEKIRR